MVEETGGPGENHDLLQVTDKLYHIILYTLPSSRIELTISVVIGINCIGSCKSNHHTIRIMKAPTQISVQKYNDQLVCLLDGV